MNVIRGNLLDLAEQGEFDLIVHGCNCMGEMGAGIAKQIRARFPAAYAADRETKRGDAGKLGSYSHAVIDAAPRPFIIVNAYTQFDWKGRGVKADYAAIAQVFEAIGRDFAGRRIGYPRIGAGSAGGDWELIGGIIDGALDGCDHALVEYAARA